MKGHCEDCGLCCQDTEMILTNEDIERICRKYFNNPNETSFYEFKDGFRILTNINGNCFFYDAETKSCKIYDFRPEGCQIYPLIYDEEQSKCILDNECPRRYQFYKNPKKFKRSCLKLTKLIKKIYEEI